MYISLGTGGVDICTFNVSSGALSKTNQILRPKASANSDQGMAVDPSSTYLFVAETGLNGVRVFSIASTGALTELSGSPYATGLGPSAVLVDSTGAYVYVTNRTDGTVSAFSLSDYGRPDADHRITIFDEDASRRLDRRHLPYLPRGCVYKRVARICRFSRFKPRLRAR